MALIKKKWDEEKVYVKGVFRLSLNDTTYVWLVPNARNHHYQVFKLTWYDVRVIGSQGKSKHVVK